MSRLLVSLVALTLLIQGLAACQDDEPARTVTISGFAFDFGPTPATVKHVEVFVAEHPELRTTTDASGYFALEVPDGAWITPVIMNPGGPVEYLQSFHTAGQDLTDVNFQVISDLFYDIFASILEADPDPARCQIATTVNVAEIKGLSLEEFWAYGHHGVAGATVTVEPPLDPACGPVYFDEQTMPDRSLAATTIDGGVVWYNVPPGVYTFQAHHPDRAFQPFTARCEPGRFINAGPPWGLHEVD